MKHLSNTDWEQAYQHVMEVHAQIHTYAVEQPLVLNPEQVFQPTIHDIWTIMERYVFQCERSPELYEAMLKVRFR